MTDLLPLAHAGHWLTNLLYLLPVVLVVGLLVVQTIKERRRAEQEGELGDPPPPGA